MFSEEKSPFTPRILYTAAFLLIALRFLWLGDTVYILDEAFLQIRIDENLAAGIIPFSNSRGSSIPLPYGPGGLWFYMLVRQISWEPLVNVVAHLLVQGIGLFFFERAVRRAYGVEAAAWCFVLAASSPLLFFYARHPWDNTLLIPLTAMVLWLLQKWKEGASEIWVHVGLGAVAGYALNTHLMFGPVMVGLSLTVLLGNLQRYGWKKLRGWALSFAFAITALTVLTPYLMEAIGIATAELPFENSRTRQHWGDARNLWWIFQRTALFSSLFNARIQLDDVRTHLYTFAGPVAALFFKIDFFGWFGKLAAWLSAFAVLFAFFRGKLERDPIRLFAALSFFFVLLVYQYLNIPMEPHYFNPVWWFVFVGIAAAIVWLHSWWKRIFLFTLAASAAVNASYVAFAMAYIHENRGARNMQTSVVFSEQRRNLLEICYWAKSQKLRFVRIDKNAVFLERPAFKFLPAHMPECAGLIFSFSDPGEPADVRLRHPSDSATSAALIAEPVTN